MKQLKQAQCIECQSNRWEYVFTDRHCRNCGKDTLQIPTRNARDFSGWQRKGPEGYPVYQEQAQNQRGINIPVSGVTGFPRAKGTSHAGDFAKERYAGKPILMTEARELHRAMLAEMRAFPKPKLVS